jgi:hypothetical protein
MDGSDMGDAGALPKGGLLASEGNFVDGIIAALEGGSRGDSRSEVETWKLPR